ncbi:MAG: NADH:ubiquinone oxidoreductase, subunit RnfA, partial [Ruminococcaceae bacterium]|nr:NADH:ubiquinone oxidoreductase, subunit RnfA [Oscillospiraceae bacterium]
LLTSVNLISGILYYFFYTGVVAKSGLSAYFRPLSMVACALVAFIIVYIIAVKFAAYENINKCIQAMPLATFNCTVIGTLLLATTRQYSLGGVIGFNLGSSIGYILAVLLVTEGRRRIDFSKVPAAFRGLPVMLLYISGLALAVYGLTGYSFSF